MARKNIAFPVVLRNAKKDSCVIIYWKRAEYYGGPHVGCDVVTTNNGEGTAFDPFDEIEMCIGNGFKFVHVAENWMARDEYIAELEAKIDKMQADCPEGGCLVEV